jgi:ketosteroid isomerase-like protein
MEASSFIERSLPAARRARQYGSGSALHRLRITVDRAGAALVPSPIPDADPGNQRAVVDAFLAASREGDFEALIAILDPDVVLRADAGAALAGRSRLVRGATAVAKQSLTFASSGEGEARPALVNGAAGVVFSSLGRPFAVVGFTVSRGRIVEIDVLADPARVQQLAVDVLDD